MTAGGAQGLEFGPFPQDIPRLKQKATGRTTSNQTVDPDLIWNRSRRLVEGFYEYTGRLNYTLAGVTATSINLEHGLIPVGVQSDFISSITIVEHNITAPATPIVRAWDGDAGARVSLGVGAQNDQLAAIFHGTIFVPTPSDYALSWTLDTPDPLGGSLLAGSILRLRLMR